MFKLAVLSGKGGTGKTTVSSALFALSGNSIIADCDVDAPDLHIILHPEIRESGDFIGGAKAVLDADKCVSCGICAGCCAFLAIKDRSGNIVINPSACEGCGLCAKLCPAGAISMRRFKSGEWHVSNTKYGIMTHALLFPGEENSGKLVRLIKDKAHDEADRSKAGLVLYDGPPGIGCSVISTLSGSDAVLAVTEATVSGKNDLKRLYELIEHFKLRFILCINKHDLNSGISADMEIFGRKYGALGTFKIPYDDAVINSIRNREIILKTKGPAVDAVMALYELIKMRLLS